MTIKAQPQTVQVYQVFIRATPEAIWEAITRPEFTSRYFHGAFVENTPERHTTHSREGKLYGDEAVLEWDPPRRLVHGWRSLYDDELAKEPESRVTWEIEKDDDEEGVCLLTVTHDLLEQSPQTAARVAGPGWMWVLSGLKTWLETGRPLSE
jgi:uncharacterized protein YndB with AHSA1/START domain